MFNLRRGYGTREFDAQPYRAAGPVTIEEYESRADRYDTQLKEILGIDTDGKTSEEKRDILREYRESENTKTVAD